MTTLTADGTKPTAPSRVRKEEQAGPPRPRSRGEHRALVARLADAHLWPAAAASLLANLGFRLVTTGAFPEECHLLVAVRGRPTLEHFDPEDVTYFAMTGARGELVHVDRRCIEAPGESMELRALWGHVHVADRIPVENRFLTFGGTLRGAVVESGLAVLDLWSPAPIVRWGGHSQGVDPVTAAIGAFFGRLIVPVGLSRDVEARVDSLAPQVLYRAFLLDLKYRVARAALRGFGDGAVELWLAGAWARAQVDRDACEAALKLLEELHLA